MVGRYDLTDFEWATLEPLLPTKPRDLLRLDDRRVLIGILWVLRSGVPRRDLPGATAHTWLFATACVKPHLGRSDGCHRGDYDANWISDLIESQEAATNIPDHGNRKVTHALSPTFYRECNCVEHFFNWIKHFRRFATRHEKLAENCFGMIKLATIGFWLPNSAPINLSTA